MTSPIPTLVTLRDVLESDLPIFFEQQREPEANQMAAFPARDHHHFMAHWARIMANPTGLLKTILFGDQVAGNIVSYKMEDDVEIGYWLGRNYWGKGIATQALTALVALIATRPLYAHVAKHNIGSRRVLEKCGFVICGEDNGLPDNPVEEFVLKLD